MHGLSQIFHAWRTPAGQARDVVHRNPIAVLTACIALLSAVLGAVTPAQAQTPSQAQLQAQTPPSVGLESRQAPPYPAEATEQARWQTELAAFAKADSAHPPAPGGVLFVGSSTIRLWSDVAQQFWQVPGVINRGFGGSTMADCSLFAHELVLRYKPRHVLVYAGDNDLAQGHSPIQVLASFASFANTVRAELPDTRISFISVKPSPRRAALLPKIRETNNVLIAYIKTLANSDFIDIFTPMLGADGSPRSDLFRGDRLHLNDDGYRLWHSVISAHLASPAAATPRAGTLTPAP